MKVDFISYKSTEIMGMGRGLDLCHRHAHYLEKFAVSRDFMKALWMPSYTCSPVGGRVRQPCACKERAAIFVVHCVLLTTGPDWTNRNIRSK